MKEQVATSPEQQVTEKKKQNKPRKWFRMAFIISVLSAFLSISAFADGEASITTVTASFSTLTDMVSQVFTVIVSNPLLVVFLAAALLRVGIGLFRSLRRAAR